MNLFGMTFGMNFRVLIEKKDSTLERIGKLLKLMDVTIYDLREARVVDGTTNEVKSETYILCCRAMPKVYRLLKNEGFSEMNYEGFKTLY